MQYEKQQRLIKKQTLTGAELAEIEQLANVCNDYEHLHMHINYVLPRTQPDKEKETNDFLFYEDGALVGYLALDDFGSTERELTGMVHPSYRRKGIFRTLLMAARDECMQRGIGRLVLVCERASASGQAFSKAIHAQLNRSEYQMVLETFQPRAMFDDRLSIQQANERDLDALVAILSAGFSDREDTRDLVSKVLQEPGRHVYLATFGCEELGCHEPVGTLTLDENQYEVGIYGLVVIPDYRGRGYGRQMLEEVIRNMQACNRKEIMLEVEVENMPAVNLYRSCGFEIRTTYDYYALERD